MARVSYREQARGRLLDLWQRHEDFGEPVGCVSTTFTFDAPFYEEECLGRFVGMDSNPREDGKLYLVEREEKLAEVFAAVVVDQNHVAPQRSLRWHLLPARVPGGGILHSKVTVLAWRELVRVLIGSANLTEPAYRRNYEQMVALDFRPEGELPRELLRDVIAFVERVVTFSTVNEEGPGPAEGLRRFLGQVSRLTRRWSFGDWKRGQPSLEFLPVLPGRPSLFDQAAGLWSGTGPDFASVCSPFYEGGDGAQSLVQQLVGIMAPNGQRTVEFCASGREFDDGRVELDLPESLAEPSARRCRHEFCLVQDKDEEDKEERRNLHAKSLWLERGDKALFLVGSSNFTGAGTGAGSGATNVEANVAYRLPSVKSRFAKICLAASPPMTRLDRKEHDLRFVPTGESATADVNPYARLPLAFGPALYRVEKDAGVLDLSIGAKVPAGFTVLTDAGESLLSETEWAKGGRPEKAEVRWPEARPPSCLIVSWRADDGELRQAIWPVNALETSALPPPDELRNLTLDELVLILTSARPLHEVLRQVLRRRERRSAGPGKDVIDDPHKRVDTSGFLLRRMRRVGNALEGLRARLERPVWSTDGLRWRLMGPIGPVSVARSLVAGERSDGAAFMLAEVALTVARTDWSYASKHLGNEIVRKQVTEVLELLREEASRHEAPEGLRAYVLEAFAEARG